MPKAHTWFVASLALSAALHAACSSSDGGDDPNGTLDALPDTASDSTAGPVAVPGSSTEVWEVRNQWADTTTAAAKAPGLAWGADSGLSWEAKYSAWMASMQKIPTEDHWNQTIEISTPYGKKIQPPHLECAETAMILRGLFASWYHLPFYMTGWNDKTKRALYAGHFGFVDGSGQQAAPFPRFKAQYADHEGSWQSGAPWPKDSALRALHLDTGADDGVSFLEAGAGAGAWLDEVVVNKRVGYFLRLLLVYFGSINLADSANMFNITPEATSPGDVLLERWQKNGIGHTIQVVRVDTIKDKPAPVVVTGSMPRRQPVWEEALDARHYFTSEMTGGEGQSFDNHPYATLGGGIHRWRTPVLTSGKWNNVVPTVDAPVFIPAKNTTAIAARPAHFDQILALGSPEDRRDAALGMIATARTKLRQHPASCSARTLREDGFYMLYNALGQLEGKSQATIDAENRKLEDYVFTELMYTTSKTCCWDSTTDAMSDIILDLAQKEQDDAKARKVCAPPTVFMAQPNAGDGYKPWKDHAAQMGRAGDWKAWSEDEPCSQRAVTQDETLRSNDFCPATPDGADAGPSGAPVGDAPDAGGGSTADGG